MRAKLNKGTLVQRLTRVTTATCISIALASCLATEEPLKPGEKKPLTPEEQQKFMMEKVESWSAAEPDIQRILALESDMQLIIDQLAGMAELDSNPLKVEPKTNNTDEKEFASEGQLGGQTHSSNEIASGHQEGSTKDLNYADPTTAYLTPPPHGAEAIGKHYGQANEINSNDHDKNNTLERSQGNCQTAKGSRGHCFPKVGLHIAMFKDIQNLPKGWAYMKSILPKKIVNIKPLVVPINYQEEEYYSMRIGPFKSPNSANTLCKYLQQKQHYCSIVQYKGLSFN